MIHCGVIRLVPKTFSGPLTDFDVGTKPNGGYVSPLVKQEKKNKKNMFMISSQGKFFLFLAYIMLLLKMITCGAAAVVGCRGEDLFLRSVHASKIP